MFDFFKGFKTITAVIVMTALGGLTAGGFLTPEMSADITVAGREAIAATEKTAALIEILGGLLFGALRAVTSSKIFQKE